MSGPAQNTGNWEVTLPAGGILHLQSAEEVELFENSHRKYIEDYHLTKQNDLHLLGIILQQQILAFRAQRKLNGMEAEVDASNVPTGRYVRAEIDSDEYRAYSELLLKASGEIQKIEKALGIDKVSREAGGAVSIEHYLRTLKKAAHERGIHISKRVLAYEAFVNDLRTRLRILRNADAEDRAYHDITPEKILEWADGQLSELESVDKQFAREKGKIYVGKL
jgi:hypothetical protein